MCAMTAMVGATPGSPTDGDVKARGVEARGVMVETGEEQDQSLNERIAGRIAAYAAGAPSQ